MWNELTCLQQVTVVESFMRVDVKLYEAERQTTLCEILGAPLVAKRQAVGLPSPEHPGIPN